MYKDLYLQIKGQLEKLNEKDITPSLILTMLTHQINKAERKNEIWFCINLAYFEFINKRLLNGDGRFAFINVDGVNKNSKSWKEYFDKYVLNNLDKNNMEILKEAEQNLDINVKNMLLGKKEIVNNTTNKNINYSDDNVYLNKNTLIKEGNFVDKVVVPDELFNLLSSNDALIATVNSKDYKKTYEKFNFFNKKMLLDELNDKKMIIKSDFEKIATCSPIVVDIMLKSKNTIKKVAKMIDYGFKNKLSEIIGRPIIAQGGTKIGVMSHKVNGIAK